MSRVNEKWFGFYLSQKQAVWIFILSLIGVIVTSYTAISLFYPYLIMIFTSSYYDIDNFIQMMLMMAPMFGLILIFLAISIYTLIKTRIIAKYYSENLT